MGRQELDVWGGLVEIHFGQLGAWPRDDGFQTKALLGRPMPGR